MNGLNRVYVKEILQLLNSYKFKILVIIAITFTFFIQLTFWMKKQYKTDFEINVYSKYFKNPLISAFLPDLYNVSEMKSTIDSMIKEGINNQFIDTIGDKYKFYTAQDSVFERAQKRSQISKMFSYYPTGAQSYKVHVTYSDPIIAKKIADDALGNLKTLFINSKLSAIERVRKIMAQKLEAMNVTRSLPSGDEDKLIATKSPNVIHDEIIKLKNKLMALSKNYKDIHPQVLLTKSKIKRLESLYKINQNTTSNSDVTTLVNNKVVSNQVFENFYSKYQDFNIALDIEKKAIKEYIAVLKLPHIPLSPISPKKRIFASIGLLLGCMFSFLYILLDQILKPNRLDILKNESKELNSFYLGTLPQFDKAGS